MYVYIITTSTCTFTAWEVIWCDYMIFTPPGSVLAHYDSELQRLRSEYAGLSGSKREALEHLLMEGDLLEVTMDEVQQLWQLLQLDTEYLSAFDTSPAKVGRTAPPKEVYTRVHVYSVFHY